MKRTSTAGIREAKAHLSEYIHRVERGQTVLITDRGRVVAQLCPPGSTPSGAEDALARLVLEQRVRAPLSPRDPKTQVFTWKGLGKPAGTAHRTVDELREER
jgi:prevent-host-death family protein